MSAAARPIVRRVRVAVRVKTVVLRWSTGAIWQHTVVIKIVAMPVAMAVVMFVMAPMVMPMFVCMVMFV